MKIGKLVKMYVQDIFQYCEKSNLIELNQLKDKTYSNRQFGIGFPFCSTVEIASLNSKRYWKDTFEVNGERLRVSSQWNVKHTNKFLNYLQRLNLIDQKELKELNASVLESHAAPESNSIKEPIRTVENSRILKPENYFDASLINEAKFMSIQYQRFYCLERSIRELIRNSLEKKHGIDWWKTIDEVVKRNVAKNLDYELDTTHTKRSEHEIDYTTFGDLRKIINTNWEIFEHKFNRKLSSVNEVMIDLNRIRVSIAHCTPLANKEIKRLEIRIDDWYALIIK